MELATARARPGTPEELRALVAHPPVWLAVAVLSLLIPIGIAVIGVQVAIWDLILIKCAALMILMSIAAIALGFGGHRIASAVFTLLAVVVVSNLSMISSCLWAMWDVPLQDTLFLRADAMLGIHWYGISDWLRTQPQLSRGLSTAYSSLLWQPFVVIALLAALAPERLRHLAGAWALTLVVVVIVGLGLPAVGAYVHLGLPRAAFPDIQVDSQFEIVMAGLRDMSQRTLTADLLSGVVAFPSFHAGAAVILGLAWWHLPIWRYVGVPLNVVMFVASVPCGAHYVVDVIVGGVIAAASCYAIHAYYRARDTVSPPLAFMPLKDIVAWRPTMPALVARRHVA